MKIDVRKESISSLRDYANVSIAFTVDRIFDISVRDEREFVLSERHLEAPYIKDYDSIEYEHPINWAGRFDTSNWASFVARTNNQLVGGAVVAHRSSDLEMLEGRDDLAVLWDIRVSPESRGLGIGSILLSAVEKWAVSNGCRTLKVETQNINVPACNFYIKHGFRLRDINRQAYSEFPDEIQMLWYKELG